MINTESLKSMPSDFKEELRKHATILIIALVEGWQKAGILEGSIFSEENTVEEFAGVNLVKEWLLDKVMIGLTTMLDRWDLADRLPGLQRMKQPLVEMKA